MTRVEDWAQAGSYLTWRSHNVFVREEGEGEPLLLIHGVPTSSWIWHRVWPLLLPGHRLIAIDLLGFGLSDKPHDLIADVFAQADLCEHVCGSRGIERYRVLAADYGATIAQELLARANATAIASVCLLNGGIFPEAHRPPLAQRLISTKLGRPLARFIWRGAFERSILRLFGPRTKPDEASLDALWRLLMNNGGRTAMPALMAYTAARREHRDRWVSALARSDAPCRFICGAADPVCGEEMRALWRACVPGGDVVELPDVGHWPAFEAPEAVTDAVKDFHQRHPL